MTKNINGIIYGLEDKPPILINIFLGFQHVLMLTSMFVLPLLLVAASNDNADIAVRMIQASMLVMGIGTIILSSKIRFLGSGYLASPINDPSFFPVSLVAVKLGGLPLLYTLNYFHSLLQIGFSMVLPNLRKYFPIEITGLVVLMIGISIISVATTNAIGGVNDIGDLHWNHASILISSTTLLVMIIFSIWGSKRLIKYALMIGIIWGCIIAYLTHQLNFSINNLPAHQWFSLPQIVGWNLSKFNIDLLLPMFVAVIAVTLKSSGGIITAQKINDPNWVRMEPNSLRRGLLTTGLSSLLAAIFGGLPMGVSSINMGLEATTGCTSRAIAWSIGMFMIILSFFPAASILFVLLPKPVLGAMLLYVISSLIVTGIQIMMSRMINTRRLYIIGLPIIMSLIFEFIPQLQRDMPKIVQILVSSPLTTATILALIINFIFLIGIIKKIEFNVDIRETFAKQVHSTVHNFGEQTGVLPKPLIQLTNAIMDSLYMLKNQEIYDHKVVIYLKYDEYNLSGIISYQGESLNIKEHETDSFIDNKINNTALESLKAHVDMVKITTRNHKHHLSLIILV